MITRISYIKNIRDFKHVIFVYGNFDFFKNSFIGFVCSVFTQWDKINRIKSIDDIQIDNVPSLFGDDKHNLFVVNVTDKDLEKIYDKIDFEKTKDRFVFIDNDFRKTKKIAADFAKSSYVQSIGFFENNAKDYIYFLNNFLNIKCPADLNTVSEYIIMRKEDPFKFFEKLEFLSEKDVESYLNNRIESESTDNEPIGLIRFLLASLKFSTDLKMLPKAQNTKINKEEAIYKLLDLESFYKKNNVRSKIFITKEFL